MVDTVPAPAASGAAPLPDPSVVPPVWGRITNLVVERGEGSWLITRDGERYLDYSAGIGVVNTGHAHPRVVAAIQEQAASSSIGIEQLQAAFANIYATMDSIDEFKLKALDTMSETIGVLENEVEKSKAYVARVQTQDQRAASGQLDLDNMGR